MRITSALRGVAAASVLAASIGLSSAPVASASTYVDVSCTSGGSRYECRVYHDATQAYSIRWKVNGVPAGFLDNAEWTMRRLCQPGGIYDIDVTVTDATGARTAYCAFMCSSGPWP